MNLHELRLIMADSFFTRLLGLMGLREFPAADGVLLTRTKTVHTCFMRMTIDVLYLDGMGKVLRVDANLHPWRIGAGPGGTRHALEMRAGGAQLLDIQCGDSVVIPDRRDIPRRRQRQLGASMVEFAIVAPLISLMGLGIIQYGMLFFAKRNFDHAAFMAARAGANGHADMVKVRDAYFQALVPLYAQGRSQQDLVNARQRAEADLAGATRFELLNPTKESFDDWNDPEAQKRLATGSKRVIPNSGLSFRSLTVKQASGQSIQDANIIKLRITQGVQPRVPLISTIYMRMLGWLDPKADSFHTALVNDGRIPVVTHVTMYMNSDAIEPDSPVSVPGKGNGGSPVNPGDPPVSQGTVPSCSTAGCTINDPPAKPPGNPPACNPATDANSCRPPGCVPGDKTCDPACGVSTCCGVF